jgi:hypothetical protein
MLEHSALLLRAWTSVGGAAPRRVRHIVDAATKDPLGFAAEEPVARGWLSWLTRPAFAVHEFEDEPLVFTVHPIWSWNWRWEVHDADEHCVGIVNGPSLEDFAGRRIALLSRRPRGGCFTARNGEEIATLSGQGADTVLRFAENFGGNPFAKMLLLAAALAQRVHP